MNAKDQGLKFVPPSRLPDRHWLAGRLTEAAVRLVRSVDVTADSGLVVNSTDDVLARAQVLNDLVMVEHYMRKIATSYGLLAPYRKEHSARVAPVKRARLPLATELALAARIIRELDSSVPDTPHRSIEQGVKPCPLSGEST